MFGLQALFGVPRSFRHGTHPDPHKDTTSGLKVEHLELQPEYVLPLSQHAGTPSRPCVEPGTRVRRGQRIAEPDGFRSVALHSPVAGTVGKVEQRSHPGGGLAPALVVQTDFYADQEVLAEPPLRDPDAEQLLERIQGAGVVGMGGAVYPAHAKLRLPEGKRVDVVILNGAECEPYLTADHRLMVERADAVIGGLRIIMCLTGAKQGRIGVETNKPDAIEALERAITSDLDAEVISVAVKYPEGAKQMLIETLTGLRVPLRGRSVDMHVTIHNVASAAAIYDACHDGHPVIERVVTVTGPGIKRPANVLTPIGTPLSALIDHCGGLLPEARAVVLGGAMMGQTQVDFDVPVLKGTAGALVLTSEAAMQEEMPCIRCGRCVEACPMFLNPTQLVALTRAGQVEALDAHDVSACFECGSCAYVCPSYIPLTEVIRSGKQLVRKASS
jgi:electron transport complex protein RnfC